MSVGVISLSVSGGLISLRAVGLLVGRLRNIAGSGNLVSCVLIALRHVTLSRLLGICASLRITRLPRISRLPLLIILLGVWILIRALIWCRRRLVSGNPALLKTILAADNRLASRHLRRLIHALCRLESGLLGLIGLLWLKRLLILVPRLLGLLVSLL